MLGDACLCGNGQQRICLFIFWPALDQHVLAYLHVVEEAMRAVKPAAGLKNAAVAASKTRGLAEDLVQLMFVDADTLQTDVQSFVQATCRRINVARVTPEAKQRLS